MSRSSSPALSSISVNTDESEFVDTDVNPHTLAIANALNISKTAALGSFLDAVLPFSGQDQSYTVSDYFALIDDIGKHQRWSDFDKLLVARLRLTGEALQFYKQQRQLRSTSSYSDFVLAFKDRFEERSEPHLAIRDLVQSYQRPNESVKQFASRLEALSYHTIAPSLEKDEGAEACRLNLLKSAFLQGLRPELRRLVLPQNSKTYSQAKEAACWEESHWRSNHLAAADHAVNINYNNSHQVTPPSHPGPSTEKSQIEELTSLVRELSTQVVELNRKVEATTSKTRPEKNRSHCEYCRKRGHEMKDCYSKRRDEQTRPKYYEYQNQRDRFPTTHKNFQPVRQTQNVSRPYYGSKPASNVRRPLN